ncbi:hypothetical protein BGX26_011817 [Mortierella sp. AD094]|nr:hypothetical protein BGX26_011817 [Mortierella sp. AD094]
MQISKCQNNSDAINELSIEILPPLYHIDFTAMARNQTSRHTGRDEHPNPTAKEIKIDPTKLQMDDGVIEPPPQEQQQQQQQQQALENAIGLAVLHIQANENGVNENANGNGAA